MLGNGVKMSFIFRRILGLLVLGWAPNHLVLGAQLGPDEKGLVCIPGLDSGWAYSQSIYQIKTS